MDSQVLKGSDVVKELKTELQRELSQLETAPNLAIIRVGDQPGQISYEKSATRLMRGLGIETTSFTFPETISQEALDQSVQLVNNLHDVHSILLLKPLPEHLSDAYVNKMIDSKKDIDCIGETNIAKFYLDDYSRFAPCTAEACIEILDYLNFDYRGKNVTMVGFGMVIGKPLTLLLVNRGCTVTVCQKYTDDLVGKTKHADVIITATGVVDLIRAAHVNSEVIVLDVGVNEKADGQIVGDCHFSEIVDLVKAVTPVPGGVGTVTNMILAKHVLRSYRLQTDEGQ